MRPASRRILGRRGVVASELALVAPLFFFVVLATSDLVSVFRAQLRTEAISVQIGQIVSQCRAASGNPAITAGDVTNFWTQAGRIAGDVININGTDTTFGGAMVISAVSRRLDGSGNPTNANTLSWQRRTGNANRVSRLGTGVGSAVTISANPPTNFIVPTGQTLLVTEVFAVVQPWVLSAGLIGPALNRNVYGTTLFLSRAPQPAALQTAPTTANTPSCTA